MFENNNYIERINKLDFDLRAVCLIDGVSIGDWNDKSTWRIDYKVEATIDERKTAQIIVDNFQF
jgi:hypothetical protein